MASLQCVPGTRKLLPCSGMSEWSSTWCSGRSTTAADIWRAMPLGAADIARTLRATFPDIALHRQEETLTLAWRQLARHDGPGVVDQVLWCREDADYASDLVPGYDC